jgi:hypothetical protein
MALVERGRTGVTVTLAPDAVTGVVTQDPESMLHSIAGLTNADGNTAFGQTFTLGTYFTATGTGTTTTSLFSSNAPFKFRVLSCKVTMLDEANGRLRDGGANHLTVSVPGVVGADVSDLRQLESRDLPLSRSGSEVVSEDGSLSVVADVRLGDTGVTDTLAVLVELTCLRVI